MPFAVHRILPSVILRISDLQTCGGVFDFDTSEPSQSQARANQSAVSSSPAWRSGRKTASSQCHIHHFQPSAAPPNPISTSTLKGELCFWGSGALLLLTSLRGPLKQSPCHESGYRRAGVLSSPTSVSSRVLVTFFNTTPRVLHSV